MKKYTVKDFLAGKVSIRCGNDEQKKAVMKVCRENGIVWIDGESVDENYFIPIAPVLTINFFGDGRLSCGNGYHRGMNVVNFDEIDLSPAPRYQITIELNGDTTTAKMLVDGKEVKTATAKRNPADKANWRIGAQTAFDRLWKKQEKPEEKKYGGFKIGDRVVVDGKRGNAELADGKHGKVVGFDCGFVCLELDEHVYDHDCNGKAKKGHGCLAYDRQLTHEQPTKQKVREVKRHAKAGEYIKLIDEAYSFDKVGTILRVDAVLSHCALVCQKDHPTATSYDDPAFRWAYRDCVYVVLEGYKP